jgi:hypothetical protein
VVFFVVIFDAGRPGALTGHYVVCKAGGCLKKNLKKRVGPVSDKGDVGGSHRAPEMSQLTASHCSPLTMSQNRSYSPPRNPVNLTKWASFFFLLFSPVPNPSGPLEQVSGPADRSGRWQATGDGFCQAERAIWYFSDRNVSIEVGC